MTAIRTFIAVETSSAVRRRASQLIDALRASQAAVKWIEPENMHLTLKFLGDVPEENIVAVSDAVARAVAAVPPFELELRGAGAFPSVGRPRTIWLGAGAGEEQAAVLAKAIEKAVKPLRFPPEGRPFSVHLTLGRIRTPGPGMRELSDLLRQQAAFEAGRMTVAETIVFSSQLTPQGPIYTAMARAALGG